MTNKPIVHYNSSGIIRIRVGERATVNVLDHPNKQLYSNQMIETSLVLLYNEQTGVFETENSIYVPLKI